jgi:hypothetical protein
MGMLHEVQLVMLLCFLMLCSLSLCMDVGAAQTNDKACLGGNIGSLVSMPSGRLPAPEPHGPS